MVSSLDEPAGGANKKRAVIVGGGPAGGLMAVVLSRSGRFEVDVFEAFEESRISGPTIRSWNVVLFGRGVDAMGSAGVDIQEEAGDSAVPLTGSLRHHTGRVSSFFQGSTSICRGDLAKSLLDKASRMPDVRVHYGCTFSKADLLRRTATFEIGNGDTMEREYDMLVGADGVNSRVRKALEDNVADFTVRQQEDHMEFKTITIPIMDMEGAEESWKTFFHTSNSKTGCLIGAATKRGTVTAVVVLPSEGKNTFGALMKTTRDVRGFFGKHYPSAFGGGGPSEETAKDFLERRPQRLRSTYCSSLSHGNVVLIGDAGHSMWASLGQGVNAALEDTQVFAQVLESAGEGKALDQAVSVPTLLAAYNERRFEDALAAVTLSEGGIGGARTVRFRFAATMLVTMVLHKTLGRLAPKVFAPPALMEINTKPYGDVSRAMRREAAVTRGLACCGVAVGALCIVFRRLLPWKRAAGNSRSTSTQGRDHQAFARRVKARASTCGRVSPVPPAAFSSSWDEQHAIAINNSTFEMAPSSEEPVPSSEEPVAPMQRAVIVGGGPAGALMAVYLARSGRFKVDVFEALEQGNISGPTIRSWNVVLGKRGRHAIEGAGVNLQQEAGDTLIVLTGGMRHHAAEKYSPSFVGSNSICRGDLAKALLNKASTMPNVNVHYRCAFSTVDTGRRVATFEIGNGDTVEREYDMLVGADGVNSLVRKALEENVTDFTVQQREDDMEFKTISIPIMEMEGAEESWKTRFHLANSGIGMMGGSATPYGTITSVVIVPGGKNTFGALMETVQDVRDFFGTHYPSAFGREGPSEEVAKDFLERRSQRQQSTYCSSLSHGNVVLIGDAAHSMLGSLGQGVNAALEDSQVFAQVLHSATEGTPAAHAVDVPSVLAAYNERRLDDALAAVTLSERGMGGARSVRLPYQAKLQVTKLLHKTLGCLAPEVFTMPSMFSINGGTPYSEVLRGVNREDTVYRIFILSSVAAAALVGLGIVRRLRTKQKQTTAIAKTTSGPRKQQLRMASSSDEPVAPKQRAVIVGGGPAGALMAVSLARDGRFEVDVLEALEEGKVSGPTVRSWNVVLYARGSHALESAGVDLQEEAGDAMIVLTGAIRHHAAEKYSPLFAGSNSICRGDLAKTLLNKASRMPNVNVHYGCSFSNVDMGKRVATFKRASGDTVEREYDMLVGADGVNSRVRKALEENVPDFTVRQQEDDMDFKTIKVPIMEMEGADESWKTSFHLANSDVGTIGGSATPYGTITAVVILPSEGKTAFGALMKTTQDVRDFFGTHYPSTFGREGPSEEVAKDFLERRPQRQQSTYCSSLSHGNIVLIGDAGHSMLAALGQGVNAALEDSQVFAQVLDSATEDTAPARAVDVPSLLAAYNERRFDDALAVVKLSEQGIGGARSVRFPYQTKLFVTKLLHKTLGRLAPQVFMPPSMFSLGGVKPYAAILRDINREHAIYQGFIVSTIATMVLVALGIARGMRSAARMFVL
eukprot:g9749.t1